MYQAQITDTETGAPVSTASEVAALMRLMTPTAPQFEEVDAEQGIWLVSLNDWIAARVELHGGLLAWKQDGYRVDVEMP